MTHLIRTILTLSMARGNICTLFFTTIDVLVPPTLFIKTDWQVVMCDDDVILFNGWELTFLRTGFLHFGLWTPEWVPG